MSSQFGLEFFLQCNEKIKGRRLTMTIQGTRMTKRNDPHAIVANILSGVTEPREWISNGSTVKIGKVRNVEFSGGFLRLNLDTGSVVNWRCSAKLADTVLDMLMVINLVKPA